MKTCLYDKHVQLHAKMIEFGGWEMPIHYKGVLPEHHAVRERLGIFDVSHMGRIEIKGKDAEKLLDFLSTSHIQGKPIGSATYTVWCDAQGKAIDDLIIYRQGEEHFFVIVNAANRTKDLTHLVVTAASYEAQITPHYTDEGIIAIQGPKAQGLMETIFPLITGLPFMHFMEVPYKGGPILISKTGYTGAGGYEVYASKEKIVDLWDEVLEKGRALGIEPAGLGARDTLRLEMGYALYGHELNEAIAATESVSAWTVKWDKDFLGKSALEELAKSPAKRREYGVLLQEKGIPRENCEARSAGKKIGRVTSGTFSPTLQKGIAIILTKEKLAPGQDIELLIRDRAVKGKIVKLPFLPPNIEQATHEGGKT